MKFLKIIVTLLMAHSSFSQTQSLSDFTWKNRIIILSDTDTEFKDAKTALKTTTKYKRELEDRDIILFLQHNGKLYNTKIQLTNIEPSKKVPDNFTGYLLIGKDGGIKSKEPYPIKPEGIFNLIDSMPMRRAEMKSNH
ncbi:DUF4174 domain-containing protein [Maribacter sp. X9]|uniref:DUF4174 domain-containing protein n=1 Tax=Maribacter sp. X9 TaxID=3402159 RepID=UPI003AF35885